MGQNLMVSNICTAILLVVALIGNSVGDLNDPTEVCDDLGLGSERIAGWAPFRHEAYEINLTGLFRWDEDIFIHVGWGNEEASLDDGFSGPRGLITLRIGPKHDPIYEWRSEDLDFGHPGYFTEALSLRDLPIGPPELESINEVTEIVLTMEHQDQEYIWYDGTDYDSQIGVWKCRDSSTQDPSLILGLEPSTLVILLGAAVLMVFTVGALCQASKRTQGVLVDAQPASSPTQLSCESQNHGEKIQTEFL